MGPIPPPVLSSVFFAAAGLEIGLNFHLPVGQLAKKLTSPSQKYNLSVLIIVKQGHTSIWTSSLKLNLSFPDCWSSRTIGRGQFRTVVGCFILIGVTKAVFNKHVSTILSLPCVTVIKLYFKSYTQYGNIWMILIRCSNCSQCTCMWSIVWSTVWLIAWSIRYDWA